MDVLKIIDDLRAYDLDINGVVITRYNNQPSATMFMNKLERRGIKVYTHRSTKGYPTDVDTIVSDEGYGKNPYIETTKPIVVVTAPGPGSGKLATCLSQLYHENKRGRAVGYSKFETFPVWNIPLKHPLNIAYESATVDLKDVNLIDSFHVDAYGDIAVNYNRDIETFPVLRRIIEKITGEESVYKSPTDMGVNRVGFGIVDDEVVQEASRQEIIRRYFKTGCEYKKGYVDFETYQRAELIMEELGLGPVDRKVVAPARLKAEELKKIDECKEVCSVVAIEMPDGKVITGRTKDLMDSTAAAILNSIKYLAKMDDEIHLIAPVILEPIMKLKTESLGSKVITLDAEEILIALSISAVTNPVANVALDKLKDLAGCQAHTTTILNTNNERIFRNLQIDVTSEPEYSSNSLYESK